MPTKREPYRETRWLVMAKWEGGKRCRFGDYPTRCLARDAMREDQKWAKPRDVRLSVVKGELREV